MRSPVLALLWENWRLTRREVAQRLVQGIVLAAAVPVWFAASGPIGNGTARFALGLLVLTQAPLWLSVARLNGGRFMDGYRPGYPFYFLYTRPVRTVVVVGAPMAYLVTSAVAAYIVSALVLRATFGYPFPLLPLAAWIAAFHMVQWAAQWWSPNKVVQWVGTMPSLGFAALAMWRWREWPARLDFSIGDYALLASIGVASFGLTVAGVARQRRGDAQAFSPRTVTRSGFWDWLADLFPIPCPTASATRAQIWFELKSSGLPVLAIGLALAVVIPLLVVVTTQIDVVLSGFYPRPASLAGPASLTTAMAVAVFSLPAVLLLGGNAFGIRARQGRMYASAFEATQACGTPRMAGLKLLVRSVCLLVALVAVGVSVWASLSFIAVSEGGAPLRAYEPLRGWQRAIEGTGGAMSASQLLALAFVTVIAVAVMIGSRASLVALRARYPRHVKSTVSVLLLYGLARVLLALAGQRGFGLETLSYALVAATPWIAAAATVFATVFLFWSVLAERLLTLRLACGAVLVSVAFGVAWVMVLRAAGVPLSGLPATDAVWLLSPALLPLTTSVLAPWSLSRVRHA